MRKYNLLDSLSSLETLELKLSPSSLAVGVVVAHGGVAQSACQAQTMTTMTMRRRRR